MNALVIDDSKAVRSILRRMLNEYMMKPFTQQVLHEKLGLPEADACARSEF